MKKLLKWSKIPSIISIELHCLNSQKREKQIQKEITFYPNNRKDSDERGKQAREPPLSLPLSKGQEEASSYSVCAYLLKYFIFIIIYKLMRLYIL